MRSFENWLTQEVEDTFGVSQLEDMPLLEHWLASGREATGQLDESLEHARRRLVRNADFWNEDELKLMFIAPVLAFVEYETDRFKPFSQRRLRAVIDGVEVAGVVDFMVARGRQIPKEPFFFLHEYKQEARRDTDPKGQLLIEMLAAATLNGNGLPLYGCYVTGRFWYFVVLSERRYAVSRAFDASREEDLRAVVAMLLQVKGYIAESA